MSLQPTGVQPSARIVIDIDASGICHLRSEFKIPKLLAELRAQLLAAAEGQGAA